MEYVLSFYFFVITFKTRQAVISLVFSPGTFRQLAW